MVDKSCSISYLSGVLQWFTFCNFSSVKILFLGKKLLGPAMLYVKQRLLKNNFFHVKEVIFK